ncbi:MAG TPA: endopeptidase La [Syntrophobacteraceae bacterium]|nr:endopeptidase La [Syntrophobacteraceae bacterium]
MIMPLFVGEPHELQAVEMALKASGYLFLALCNHDQQGLPPRQMIHPLGCVALLLQHSPSTDGRLKILVQGLNKATIRSFVQTQPFYAVAVHSDPEGEPAKLDPSVLLLMNRVRSSGIKWFVLHGMYAQDAEIILESATTPERLADLVIADLRLSADTRHQLLTITDPKEKLRKTYDLLLQQLEQSQIKAEIRFEADEAIHRRHRDRYLREQLRAIRRELGELDDEDDLSHYRTRVEQLRLPKEARTEALRQLRRLQQMHTDAAEAAVIRSYLDWLVELPWQKSSRDGLNLRAAQQILDDNHYNMAPIKERVLDFLGVCKLKRRIKGPILCLVGPPGVGKTSLGRSIAKAMGRKFVRIALGGLRDEAEIRGHRRTYLGSLPGRIIQGIKTAGTNNPVFMLDEIDKVGSDFRGDPAAALLEVLDPDHNRTFSDHYLNVPFDLSRVLFLTTANSTDTIPRTLLDRMEVLHLSGYSDGEKQAIALHHLVPRQLREHGIPPALVKFSSTALLDVIQGYTHESGVRNLEREIAKLCRKVARKLASGLHGPFAINRRSLTEYLGPPRYVHDLDQDCAPVGVALGLAYTPMGGALLRIEVAVMPGSGNLILTGQLGEVMKESAQAALSYVRSKSSSLGLQADFYSHVDIHIHLPSGAIPKDGPSAGIPLAAAMVSALCRRPIRPGVAMTGEISLQGKVLPVGSLKEKSLAAIRASLKEVVVPKLNDRELQELAAEFTRHLTFVPVTHLDEVLEYVVMS